MFSPIFAMSARRRSSTVSPLGSFPASRASSEAGLPARATAATACAKPRKSCSRATKSVSQLISTRAAVCASLDFSTTTTPSAATRDAFLSAFASPCLRMRSAAASRSPFVSTSAFLHSIMPAPVRSRSCFTASAVMFIREESSFSAAALATTGSARGAARRGYLRGGRADCSGRGSRDFLCIQVLVIHHRATLNNRSDNRHTRDRRPAPSASTRLLTHRSGRTRASTLLLTRIASLVELHELVFAGRHRGHRFLAFEDRISDASGIQTNRAHGVVVTGDHVVDAVRGAIRVDDRDDWDAELGGFV